MTDDDTLEPPRCTHIKGASIKLGELRMEWFKKLPPGSIRSFLQLFESFVARFVINTRASKGVNSLLTFHKGNNETLINHNKRY